MGEPWFPHARGPRFESWRARVVVGIVSPGAMGSGFARVLASDGVRVVASAAGRSERTRRLAGDSGVELLGSLDDVVEAADVVLSIVPPDQARQVADAVAEATGRTGATPLVVDLNAIAPATAIEIQALLAEAGLDLVDGSISGPPPGTRGETRVYLSGARAYEIAALGGHGVTWLPVGEHAGAASAVKMSTASVYKGSGALLLQALLTARANGVLDAVLADLHGSWPELVEGVSGWLQSSASKAGRYVGEMEEIAATQAAAGLTPELFEAMADIYRELARSPLAAHAPEDVDPARPLEDVLEAIAQRS
jgi:3-hydroxyisobutyrate dehydrogenase-like beta-hydroxyacid dehydrogenase